MSCVLKTCLEGCTWNCEELRWGHGWGGEWGLITHSALSTHTLSTHMYIYELTCVYTYHVRYMCVYIYTHSPFWKKSITDKSLFHHQLQSQPTPSLYGIHSFVRRAYSSNIFYTFQ